MKGDRYIEEMKKQTALMAKSRIDNAAGIGVFWGLVIGLVIDWNIANMAPAGFCGASRSR